MFGKRNEEVIPDVETQIWSCTNDACNVWMRKDFSFASEPTCPICNSPMEQGVRDLPEININK
ncbi:cold-shock protein [Alicyclobacillus dauci]|uniref:Cold-shock protein n=1 Tax=Alicyclobacillus dauci TaxID=1475485 RepID=A0ABY6Z5Q8_9BACL|nr:cold-shock protein [Alicyclobacillus dauci]WAH38217.1 cold-shock protein [Alicyclobacillus dauci]